MEDVAVKRGNVELDGDKKTKGKEEEVETAKTADDGTPTAKRLHLASSVDTFTKFLVDMVNESSSTHTVVAGCEMMVFENGLWGNEKQITKALVRECYKSACHEILQFTNNRYLVGGGKGIGKSVFAVYLLQMLVKALYIVVYQRESAKYLVVPAQAKKNALDTLNLALRAYGYGAVSSSGLFKMTPEDVSLFGGLMNATGIVHLIDFDNNDAISTGVASIAGNSFRIVISSPNDARLSRFCEDTPLTSIFLPPWKLEEILQLSQLNKITLPCSPDTVVLPSLREDEVEDIQEKFGWVGGSPRNVCENTKTITKGKVDSAIAAVNREEIDKYFSPSYGYMARLVENGLLVRPVPKADNVHGFQMEFASHYVGRKLLRTWCAQARFSARELLESSSFGIGLKRGLRTYVLEEAAHALMCDGGPMKLASLNATGVGDEWDITWPKFDSEVEFDNRDMSDLVEVTPNTYARPTQSNFPAVDSFFVMPGAIFGREGWHLVGAQMTMAKMRDVDYDHLVLVRLHMLKLLQQWEDKTIYNKVVANPFIVMFVVDKDVRIQTSQDLVTTEKTLYGAAMAFPVLQFRLRLGSGFDEVVRKM